MPRLTAIIHPYYGRIAVRTTTCPVCGTEAGGTCYFQCPNSPAYYSTDQERADDEAFDHAVAAAGSFQAYDSWQHRAAGLPCPYDGYDPAPDHDDLPF